jgi:ankyrin repeat protein
VQRRFCSWDAFHLPTIGASALLTAAWDGNSAIVELLLAAGQDPDTRDNGNLTAIMVAMLRYNIVVMRYVFRDGGTVRRNLVVDVRSASLPCACIDKVED